MNGTRLWMLGAVVAALVAVFALLNTTPWASKAEVAAVRADLQGQLNRIEQDVREIRSYLMPDRRPR